MGRYVALLRGINVGKNKRISMAALRALLTDLGYTDVRTHLNSGNAVFTAPQRQPTEIAGRIEAAIAGQFGLDVRCVVITDNDLRSVVAGHPFPQVATDGSRMFALFLSAAPEPRLLAAHDPATLDPPWVRLGDRVIYQWCPDGLLKAPPVRETAEKHLGVYVTGRNWNTVTKLVEFL